MADRIAVINGGRILLVEEKATLMRRMGRKHMTIELQTPVDAIPESLAGLRPDPRRRRRAASSTPTTRAAAAHRHHLAPARPLGRRARAARRADPAGLARGHLRRTAERAGMNWRGVWAIYRSEMARTFRTILQSLVAPVISTSLYFVVFGTAIGVAHRGGRRRRVRRLHRARPDHADRADAEPLQRRPSASTSRSSSAPSTSSCRRRSPISRSSSASSARPRPSR